MFPISLLFFLIGGVVVGPIIGVAASTISFTAWTIVCPVLLVGYKFSIYDAMFCSLFMDMINGFLVAVLYNQHGILVWYRQSQLSLPPVIAGGIAGGVLSVYFIEPLVPLLKGGVPYAIIVFSLIFFGKAYRQKSATAGFTAVAVKDPSSPLSQNEPQINEPKLHEPTVNMVPEEAVMVPSHESNGPNAPLTMSTAIPTARWGGSKSWVLLLFAGMVTAAVLGIVGLGGGFCFVLVIATTFRITLLEATAYGCLMMGVLSLSVASTLTAFGKVHYALIWPHLIILAVTGAVGVVVGQRIAVRIKPWQLSLLIAVTLVICAVAVIVLDVLV